MAPTAKQFLRLSMSHYSPVTWRIAMASPAKNSASSVKPTAVKTTTPTKPANPAPINTPVKPAATNAKAAPLTPAERMKMIAEAAYFIAEKHGFSNGRELSDWTAAEKQVDALINSMSNKR